MRKKENYGVLKEIIIARHHTPTSWVVCNLSHIYSHWILWRGMRLLHTLVFHMPKSGTVISGWSRLNVFYIESCEHLQFVVLLTVHSKGISELIFSSMVYWSTYETFVGGTNLETASANSSAFLNAIFFFTKGFLPHNGLAITTYSIHCPFLMQSCKELTGKRIVAFLC